MTITTPSLLFPAISLLLLAYTNRFVVLTNVVRQLTRDDNVETCLVRRQLDNLKLRLHVIRLMQGFGVLSFVVCTVSMFFLFLNWQLGGEILFGTSLVFLVISLIMSLYEVHISTKAINMELERLNI